MIIIIDNDVDYDETDDDDDDDGGGGGVDDDDDDDDGVDDDDDDDDIDNDVDDNDDDDVDNDDDDGTRVAEPHLGCAQGEYKASSSTLLIASPPPPFLTHAFNVALRILCVKPLCIREDLGPWITESLTCVIILMRAYNTRRVGHTDSESAQHF